MTNSGTRTTSVEVRQNLVEALRLDLIGPDNNHPFAEELLPETPTRWYLTGFLVPTKAPISQRVDETSTDEIDSPAEPDGLDDAEPPDRAAVAVGLAHCDHGVTQDPEVRPAAELVDLVAGLRLEAVPEHRDGGGGEVAAG